MARIRPDFAFITNTLPAKARYEGAATCAGGGGMPSAPAPLYGSYGFCTVNCRLRARSPGYRLKVAEFFANV